MRKTNENVCVLVFRCGEGLLFRIPTNNLSLVIGNMYYDDVADLWWAVEK